MLSSTFLNHFDTLEDPRLSRHNNKRHELMDILVLVLLGTICGADSWVEICAFGLSKQEWLKTFLSLPHGIPSHDTLGRVFSLIDPHHFERCFKSWISTLQVDLNRQVIALDGKTLRGSGNKRQGQKALHLVSSWACEQRMMLGQVACLDKSNEIEAIPRLLKMLDIKGSIITIDALGCQTKITQQILDQGADYVLSLKDNQGTLSQDVRHIFELGEHQQFKKMLNRRMVEKVHDHGRVETRRYTLISARDPLMFQVRWPGLVSIGLLEVTRTTPHQVERTKMDILVLVLLGTICGADSWVEICAFGVSKQDWLKTFLSLPHGIPSHDTLGRVFSLIDSHHFEKCFKSWIHTVQVDLTRQVIALDGKTLRGSGNKRQGHSALHLVSAWACEQRLMLGQVACLDKSNEIEAIPRLLKMLDIKGSIVTIDALRCQTKITQHILDQEVDYVLSLKDNQGTLSQDVQYIFGFGEQTQFKKMLNRRMVEKIHDHGRRETRRYTLLSARDPLMFQVRWPGLNSIGLLEVTRTTNHQVERTKRYFLTSLNHEEIDLFKQAVRQHWSIEINLHWSLDVSFREDHNRTRTGHAPRNLATIRRLALYLLEKETSHKKGIACKQKTAGWDHNYLLKVLNEGQNMRENDQIEQRIKDKKMKMI